MREIGGKTLRYLRAFADLLMPRTCIVCGRKLLSDERQLCIYCRSELPLTYFWKRIHNPMADKFNLLVQMGLEESLDRIGQNSVKDVADIKDLDNVKGVADIKNLDNVKCVADIKYVSGVWNVDDVRDVDDPAGQETGEGLITETDPGFRGETGTGLRGETGTGLRGETGTGFRGAKYAYACALFFYNNDTGFRNITHNIKYQGNQEAGVHFGSLLGRHIAESEHLSDIDLIVPVPLHWKREWRRGYNQAESIARGISLETGAELNCNILHRTRHTSTQTRLEVSEKQKNVRDAFAVKDDGTLSRLSETGKGHILLVDDVFTTGATLHSCLLALRSTLPPSIRISVATLGFVGRA